MNEKNLLRNMYFVVICAIVALIAIVYNGTYAFFVSSITDNGGNRSAALTSANDLANVT